MSSLTRERVARFAPPVVAAGLPVLIVGICNAIYILNHFFVHAPYLSDSGYYSALIYHAGISPHNPNIAVYFEEYYFAFHCSPFLVIFSLLSYLQPLGRIEYYALFQAIVFAPFGYLVYAVSKHLDPRGALARLPITLFAALAFSFSGLVLTFVGYPHYEPVMVPFICLTLVCVVTGRMRLAWLFIVLAAIVREDGGFHTGLALLPLVYLRWRGVKIAPSIRQLVIMIGGAFWMSFAALLFIKTFFATNTLNDIYIGDPPFHQVNAQMLATRVANLFTSCQVILYPFAATCLLAIFRRDARYLLGWAVTVPWFLLNLLAAQELKATMPSYVAIPFAVAIFWVLLYGGLLAPIDRRLRAGVLEALFALVCLTSTAGTYRDNPVATRNIVRDLFVRGRWDRADVHAFADGIGKRHALLGKKLYVDYAVGCHTLEWLRIDSRWNSAVVDADAIAFHRELHVMDPAMRNSLVTNKLDVCTRVAKTSWMVCSHEPPPPEMFPGVPTTTFPAVFVFSNVTPSKGLTVGQDGHLVVRDNVNLPGRYDFISPGSYELTVDLDGPDVDRAKLDLAVNGKRVPDAVVHPGTKQLVTQFTVDAENAYVRFFIVPASTTPLTITGARLRRVMAPAPAL